MNEYCFIKSTQFKYKKGFFFLPVAIEYIYEYDILAAIKKFEQYHKLTNDISIGINNSFDVDSYGRQKFLGLYPGE